MNLKIIALLCLVICGLGGWGAYTFSRQSRPEPSSNPNSNPNSSADPQVAPRTPHGSFLPRKEIDILGLSTRNIQAWDPTSTQSVREAFTDLANRTIPIVDGVLKNPDLEPTQRLGSLTQKAALYLFDGKAREAYETLKDARKIVDSDPSIAEGLLYTVVYLQGISALRLGENENCLMCRGDSACIFPISETAIHTKPEGSRLAIRHFTEYLEQFPDDQGVRWLLNLSYMTLGEHPAKVPQKYLIDFSNFGKDADIGEFHDVGHLVGVNRFNQSGGAVMDDFDNDGLMDLVTSSSDPTQSMAFFHNTGDGTFEDRTEASHLNEQFGGLFLTQMDYNNDGYLDVFVPRGAWFLHPMPTSLLKNNGNGTFTEVTREVGLMDPVNSINATWSDYDNDGLLDLFVCNETGPNRLYHQNSDGTFKEVGGEAGAAGWDQLSKGSTWLDYDKDGYPDLFVNNFHRISQLLHNNGNGTFTEVTSKVGINGPLLGFSCWAFDYDNDGWTDIFATCSEHTLDTASRSLQGEAMAGKTGVTRLWRNLEGKKFQDVSHEVGVDQVFATMGSNFSDFDNDGYLDFYLATGSPFLDRLLPNRMFKNIDGKRFAEITVTARTGHLQKGHSVASGDWDRDGDLDMFVELGGGFPGDKFHNALFQNPGHGNHWLNVRLVGKKTNRAAIGAHIKVVTAGENPRTIYRDVTSGSSFGGNPLRQHIGLGSATSVATVEITWPTSGTTQVFSDIQADQAIEVTEFEEEFKTLDWSKLSVPTK